MGASVVNALSARLDVEVDRGGKTYKMSFRRGEPGRFKDPGTKPDPATLFEPFIDGSVLDVVGKAKRGVTGTRPTPNSPTMTSPRVPARPRSWSPD